MKNKFLTIFKFFFFFILVDEAVAANSIGLGLTSRSQDHGAQIQWTSPTIYQATDTGKTDYSGYILGQLWTLTDRVTDEKGMYKDLSASIFSVGVRLDTLMHDLVQPYVMFGLNSEYYPGELTETKNGLGFRGEIGCRFRYLEKNSFTISTEIVSSFKKADKVNGHPSLMKGAPINLGVEVQL